MTLSAWRVPRGVSIVNLPSADRVTAVAGVWVCRLTFPEARSLARRCVMNL
jgi:hypothetical protein